MELNLTTIERLDAAIGAKASRNDEPQEADAVVTRIAPDGTVWVHVDGGAPETPAQSTVAGVSAGDSVRVAVQGGYLRITGNTTAPSASVQSVERVDTAQRKTAATAEAAAEDASSALDAAEAANAAAQRTASYFWHDSTGAHISEQPNSLEGKHVDIDADSVDICYGDVVLASFGVASGEPFIDMLSGLFRLITDENGASMVGADEAAVSMVSEKAGRLGVEKRAAVYAQVDSRPSVMIMASSAESDSSFLVRDDGIFFTSDNIKGIPQQVKAVDFSHTGSSGTASSFTNAVTFDGGEGWVAVGVLDTYTSRYGVCPIAGARITAGSGTQSGTVTVYHYHVNSTSYNDVADTVRVLFRRA